MVIPHKLGERQRVDVSTYHAEVELKEPVWQWLKYRRHEDVEDRLVHDRVTDSDEADDHVAGEDRLNVCWHALPEMHQEALYLHQNIINHSALKYSSKVKYP